MHDSIIFEIISDVLIGALFSGVIFKLVCSGIRDLRESASKDAKNNNK